MSDFLSTLFIYSDLGVLAMRLAIGVVFLYHAKPKLKKMGTFMGFVGLIELVGGISVALGIYTQLGALLLIVIMIGAIYKKTQEWHIPFSSHEKMGWEFDLVLLGSCLALLTNGGGMHTLIGY